jgi:hypothetical protein
MPIAMVLACFIPEARWPALSARIVELGLVGRVSIDGESKYLRRFLDETMVERPLADIARDVIVQQRLLQLQTMRSLVFDGWQPNLELRGSEHLARDRLGNRGAIVWQAPFVYYALAGKINFARAGFPLYQLARYTHPTPRSRLGSCLINPILRIPEDRYLSDRIMIGRGQSAKNAMLRLADVLGQGGIVSITIGSKARSTEAFPFFKGSMVLPHGPLNLAKRAGVPILPSFTVLDGDRFLTVIEPPTTSLSNVASSIQRWTERYPEQQVWRTSLFKPNTCQRGER